MSAAKYFEKADKNLTFLSGILNNAGVKGYIHNGSFLNFRTNQDVSKYIIACTGVDSVDDIKEIFCTNCDLDILNHTIKDNCVIFQFKNREKMSKNKHISVYFNVFNKNINNDVYFTITNIKMNISTRKCSLINPLDDFKENCLEKLEEHPSNNEEFLDICLRDIDCYFSDGKCNVQFLMPKYVDYLIRCKFTNKCEYKVRIEHFINNVFNAIISKKKRETLLDIINDDFKKNNSFDLNSLIVPAGDVCSDDNCLICLEKLNSKECFRVHCCERYMHRKCVIDCEKYGHKCPNCRADWYAI